MVEQLFRRGDAGLRSRQLRQAVQECTDKVIFLARTSLKEKEVICSALSGDVPTVFIPPGACAAEFLYEFLSANVLEPCLREAGFQFLSVAGSATLLSVRSPQWMIERLQKGFKDFDQIVLDDGAFWEAATIEALCPLLEKAGARIFVIVDADTKWPFSLWRNLWNQRRVCTEAEWSRCDEPTDQEQPALAIPSDSDDLPSGPSDDLPSDLEVASRVPSYASVWTDTPYSSPETAFDTKSECARGYREVFLDDVDEPLMQFAREYLNSDLPALNLCRTVLKKLLTRPETRIQFARPGFYAVVFVPPQDVFPMKEEFERLFANLPPRPLCGIRFHVLDNEHNIVRQLQQIRTSPEIGNRLEEVYKVIFTTCIGEQLRLPFINLVLDGDIADARSRARQRARVSVVNDSIELHGFDKVAWRASSISDDSTLCEDDSENSDSGSESAPSREEGIERSVERETAKEATKEALQEASKEALKERKPRKKRRKRTEKNRALEWYNQMLEASNDGSNQQRKMQLKRQKCNWSQPYKHMSRWLARQPESSFRGWASRWIIHLYVAEDHLDYPPVRSLDVQERVSVREDGSEDPWDVQESVSEDRCGSEEDRDAVEMLAKETGIGRTPARILWAGILFDCLPSCILIAAALHVSEAVEMWRHVMSDCTTEDIIFLYKLTEIQRVVDMHHQGDLIFYRNIFVDYLSRIQGYRRPGVSVEKGPIAELMNPVFIEKWLDVVSGLLASVRPMFQFSEKVEFTTEAQWKAFNFRVSPVTEGSKREGDILYDWYPDHSVMSDGFVGNLPDGMQNLPIPVPSSKEITNLGNAKEPAVRIGMAADRIPTEFPARVTFTQTEDMRSKMDVFAKILEKDTTLPGTLFPDLLCIFPREEPLLLAALTYASQKVACAMSPHTLSECRKNLEEHNEICDKACTYERIFKIDCGDHAEIKSLFPTVSAITSYPQSGKDGNQAEDTAAGQDENQAEDTAAGQDKNQAEDTAAGRDENQAEDTAAGQDENQAEDTAAGQDENQGAASADNGEASHDKDDQVCLLETIEMNSKFQTSYAKLRSFDQRPLDISSVLIGSDVDVVLCPEGHGMTKYSTYFPFSADSFRCHNVKAHPDSDKIESLPFYYCHTCLSMSGYCLACAKLGNGKVTPSTTAVRHPNIALLRARMRISHPRLVQWRLPDARIPSVHPYSAAWWFPCENTPKQFALFTHSSPDGMLHNITILPDDDRTLLWLVALCPHPLGVQIVTAKLDKSPAIGISLLGVKVRCSLPPPAIEAAKIMRAEIRSVECSTLDYYKGTLDLTDFLRVHRGTLKSLRKAAEGLPKSDAGYSKKGRVSELLPAGGDGDSSFAEPLKQGKRVVLDQFGWQSASEDEQESEEGEKQMKNAQPSHHVPCRAIALFCDDTPASIRFSVHDIVIREKVEDDWAWGFVHASLSAGKVSGWYPTAYCEPIKHTVKAIAPFDGKTDYDFPTLRFARGDEVIVCGADDEGWTLGWHGTIGYFPTAYCK